MLDVVPGGKGVLPIGKAETGVGAGVFGKAGLEFGCGGRVDDVGLELVPYSDHPEYGSVSEVGRVAVVKEVGKLTVVSCVATVVVDVVVRAWFRWGLVRGQPGGGSPRWRWSAGVREVRSCT